MKSPLLTALYLIVVLIIPSCSRTPTYQSVLQANETAEKGMHVFVDTQDAGVVTSVSEEGGDNVVDFQITNTAARSKIRAGTMRIPMAGKIQLSTVTVKEGAQALPNGARIPVRSALLQTIVSYSSSSTIILVCFAVFALVILYLIFRSLIGSAALIICAAIAALLASAVSPWATLWVQQLYAKFPPPAAQSVPEGTASPSGLIGGAMTNIKEVVVMRPNPTMIAWCLCFLAIFIILNIVLGKVSRVWRK